MFVLTPVVAYCKIAALVGISDWVLLDTNFWTGLYSLPSVGVFLQITIASSLSGILGVIAFLEYSLRYLYC